jgi:hypothetical protein
MGKGKRNRAARKAANQYSSLKQHKQTGKVLNPPFLSIPNLRPTSWIDYRLPEQLWSALIVAAAPRDIALGVFRRVAKLCQDKFEDNKPIDIGHSGLAELPGDHRKEILSFLCGIPATRRALRPLLLLDDLPLKDEWSLHIAEQPQPQDWESLRAAVALVFDHQSQEATDCRWLKVLVMVVSGQMKLPSEEMAREILLYPSEGEQAQVRPTIRSAELAFATGPGTTPRDWPGRFWKQCLAETPCMPEELSLAATTGTRGTTVSQLVNVGKALQAHFQKTNTTTTVDAKHDAVFGIARYSLSILRELIQIGVPTSILARFGLRALLEARITLAHLRFKNLPELWSEYRSYGVGQAKLAFLKLDDESARKVGFVDAAELNAISNEDRSAEFVPINLGNWEGSNLRKMSEEAGVKSDYDSYYGWTSAYVHANWGAVRSTEFDLCVNALHRAHRVLRDSARGLNDVVADACHIVDEILAAVDAEYPAFALRVTTELADG